MSSSQSSCLHSLLLPHTYSIAIAMISGRASTGNMLPHWALLPTSPLRSGAFFRSLFLRAADAFAPDVKKGDDWVCSIKVVQPGWDYTAAANLLWFMSGERIWIWHRLLAFPLCKQKLHDCTSYSNRFGWLCLQTEILYNRLFYITAEGLLNSLDYEIR